MEVLSEIKIGPNPTKGTLLIFNTGKIFGIAKIFDLSGKILLEKSLTKEMSFELGTFTPGVYLIIIYDKDENILVSQKVIKE